MDDVEEDGQQVSGDSPETTRNHPGTTHRADANRNEVRSGSDTFSGHVLEPEEFAQQLKKEVKEKTEILRRLKMVKMYRSKVSTTSIL